MFQKITLLLLLVATHCFAAAPIDATTLHNKVMCGYQGWFGCPGDGVNQGWRHWSRDFRRVAGNALTVEMWPDMRELGDDEKYATAGFTYPDGSQAHLFSSANAKTVQRHFEWMNEYGIDGVFLQRFLVETNSQHTNLVLEHVRKSAQATGRVYAICYDLSGARQERILERLSGDWKHLVDDLHVTSDERYLHHNGKPVLFVWGFYSDRFGAILANRIIDFFKADPKYAVTLVGGCQWNWRSEKNAEWAKAFRKFDVISPWNVGNVMRAEGVKHANTGPWKADLAEAKKSGMTYLPVIYPGFGWTNLKGQAAERATIPRLGGQFLWRQFVTARELGIGMAYVAMFDEVDEGTAIFKVSNTPPTQGRFQTLENLPSDWYLRLCGEGSRLIRGERAMEKSLPITP